MAEKNSKTAIIVFARTPHEEVRAKFSRSRQSYGHKLSIAKLLNRKTLQLVTQTNLPVFWVNEKEQVGETFGQRLSNAISIIFDKGFQKVVVVGNDCPTLTSEHILEADRHISPTNLVLGPSLDGGTYLIGIHKTTFQPTVFQNLAWQSQHLLNDFSNSMPGCRENCHFLSPEIDIDHKNDLFLLLQKGYAHLIAALLVLFGLFQALVFETALLAIFQIFNLHFLKRGPPSACFH